MYYDIYVCACLSLKKSPTCDHSTGLSTNLQAVLLSSALFISATFIFQERRSHRTISKQSSNKRSQELLLWHVGTALVRHRAVFLSDPSKNAHASWESLRVQDLWERRRNHWDVSFQQPEQTVRGFPQSEAKECAVNNLADRNMETSASSWVC